MEDTFGLVDAAVAVDSHRRDGALRWRCETAKEALHNGVGLKELRDTWKQQRVVYVEGRDMIIYCDCRELNAAPH